MSIFNVPADGDKSLAHALLKIKRLGITLGIHYQGRQEKVAELAHKKLLQFIDVDISKLIDGLTHSEALQQLLTLKSICETSHVDCIVSGIEFISQRQLCLQAGLTWGYGNLIASPLDVGKIAQMHKMSTTWKDVHRWS
jgi:EAL domain-containing protein (putative c-di-GMP-specific phosphodiesterase class I)